MEEVKPVVELIEGLHVDVNGAELREMLVSREKYHAEKAKAFKSQRERLKEFEASDVELALEAGKIQTGTVMAHGQSLEHSIREHENQVVYYRFMASHVKCSAVYRLDKSELYELGIKQRGY